MHLFVMMSFTQQVHGLLKIHGLFLMDQVMLLHLPETHQVHLGHVELYGCMDVTATNYNSEANLEDGSCEYPVSLAVDLDYTTSGDLCNHVNDYDENNTNYAGFSSYMGGEDNAYYFTAQNGSVQVSVVQEEDGTGQPGVFVFDGDPLDTLTTLLLRRLEALVVTFL